MARRLLDRVPGMKRGQEPLNNEIWTNRVKELVSVLEKKPMAAPELCKFMAKNRKWPSLYTINVIAAADIDNLIHSVEGKWAALEQ
jgi:hypothetical protein